jgi:hypothetical protein
MLKVVSVSLGSSERNKTTHATFLDQQVELSRIGTDGDMRRAIELIGELDGAVDAIGLGGIDLYLCAGKRKWAVRDALKLARAAQKSPVVDGSGLKLTLERQQVDQLAVNFLEKPLKGAKALMVAGVDRWGMASGLAAYAGEIVYGDLIFALGIPIPVRTIRQLGFLAGILAPIVTQLPFKILYPTGHKQTEHQPKHTELFIWADWICGDFHFIRRNMPPRLDGKVILTNTTTEADVALLRERGAAYLVTTTPVIDGRSFGMNVLEGCIVALIRQQGDLVSPENYQVYLNKLDIKPTITQLN